MCKLIQIYQLEYDNIKLVLPTINDVKAIIMQQEWIFDKLLLNQVKITPIQVLENSKMYTTAIENTLVHFPDTTAL